MAEERREANKSIGDAQAAQAEAKVARVEGSLARQGAEELEARFNALCSRMDKAESSTRVEVERTHVDAYREVGARTADFEVPGQEAGLRFLEWWQEELLVLPTIVTGYMFFASLVTCEGASMLCHARGAGITRSSTKRMTILNVKYSRSKTLWWSSWRGHSLIGCGVCTVERLSGSGSTGQ
jgi:hypothetical protein